MNTYKPGNWNAICDVCSFKFKATELKKRWDGLMVCSKDFELDHPQKYLKVREDRTSVPWVRPRPADVFVGPICDVWDSSPLPGFGTSECSSVSGVTDREFLISLFYPSTSCIADVAIAGYSIPEVN